MDSDCTLDKSFSRTEMIPDLNSKRNTYLGVALGFSFFRFIHNLGFLFSISSHLIVKVTSHHRASLEVYSLQEEWCVLPSPGSVSGTSPPRA